MQKKLCVAGNMIVDILYPIQGLPRPGELTTILDGISRATGGAACNVAIDLAMLDDKLPLTVLGMVGADAEGDFVLERLHAYPNIESGLVLRKGMSSFTAVMSDQLSKQRTFFHYRGANAHFDESCIDWDAVDADLLHIGYILLLDALDQEDAEYGTKMARLLSSAQQHGIKTSIDVVSEAGDRFLRLVPPALRYTDYCIINELEAEQSTGVSLRDKNNTLIKENIPAALMKLKELGVSTWAVIHCPEGGFGLDESGVYTEVESLKLPPDYIKGTVGAGDAFCAGVLYGAYKEKSLQDAIVLGVASAVCSLSQSGSTEGMRSAQEALALYAQMR